MTCHRKQEGVLTAVLKQAEALKGPVSVHLCDARECRRVRHVQTPLTKVRQNEFQNYLVLITEST